jgi:tRNA splicing endonuclease
MGRTKFPALETSNAQMHAGWLSLTLNDLEHTHRTEIYARSASIAKDVVYKDLHEDGW